MKRLAQKKAALFLAICFCIIAIFLFAAVEFFGPKNFCTEQMLSDMPIGAITAEKTVTQEFHLASKRLNSFEVCFVTYGKQSNAHVTVELLDASANLLFSESFSAGELKDNAYRAFVLPEPIEKANGDFLIRISSDATSENAITVWSSALDHFDGASTYGGELQSGDIAFRLHHGEPVNALLLLSWICMLVPLALLCVAFLLWFNERIRNWMQKQVRIVDVVMCVLVGWLIALFAVVFCSLIWTKTFGLSNGFSLGNILGFVFSGANVVRSLFLLPVTVLLAAMFFYGARKTADFVFKNRWFIAIGVLVLWVLLKINFSNVSIYNNIIQPNLGDGFMGQLLGQTRSIRSDEWLVDMAQAVSTRFAGYGKFNEVLRGTSNYNLAATGLYFSIAALCEPFNLGFYLFGTEYGVSFFWCCAMIFGIMFSYEFAYIISGKNRIVGLLGVALIAFSPFNLWWSICDLIVGALGFLVCFWYFLRAQRFLSRCLYLAGAVFSVLYFVVQLYPAWQVPFVYVIMALFAWIVIENFGNIKKFKRRDWLAVAVAAVVFVFLLLCYVFEIREYSVSVLDTVYPGKRFETGGYALRKIFSYIEVFQIPFKDIVNGSNNSEASTFFAFYPLPTLLAIYTLVRQIIAKIKNKQEKIDVFTVALLVPTLFLTVYCTVGIPAWLSKITLMSFSPAFRATDFLAFANVLFLLRLVSPSNRYKLPLPVGAVLVGEALLFSIFEAEKMCPDYMTGLYLIIIFGVSLAFGIACFCLMHEKARSGIMIGFISLAIAAGVCISPINSGIGALNEKPVALKVQEISQKDPEAKWIGYNSIILGQYAVANGAPCISSVNYVPNLELWQKLDPDGQYNEVYNRYAHVILRFTEEETQFTLLTPDSMQLELSYKDIALTGAKYVLSQQPISEDSSLIDLVLLYTEDGAYIYEIQFLE